MSEREVTVSDLLHQKEVLERIAAAHIFSESGDRGDRGEILFRAVQDAEAAASRGDLGLACYILRLVQGRPVF
jgi:hypothetical protein